MVKRLASAANRNWEGRRLDAQRSVLSENMVDIGIGELLRTGHFLTGIQVPHTKQSEKLQRLLFSELDLIFFLFPYLENLRSLNPRAVATPDSSGGMVEL